MYVQYIPMLSLRVFASGSKSMSKSNRSEKRKKLIDSHKTDLNTIHDQLKNISRDERKRLQEMWKVHRNFFTDEETLDVVVMPEQSIDEYFEK